MAATMKLTIITFLLVVSALVAFGDACWDKPTGDTNVGRRRATCGVVCVQGGYITCDNYPGQRLHGCDCECAPKDGQGCVLHLNSGFTNQCTTPELLS